MIPEGKNKLLKWDANPHNGNPILPEPYLAKSASYPLAVDFHPDAHDLEEVPTHICVEEQYRDL